MGSTPGMALDLGSAIPEATPEQLAEAFDYRANYHLGVSGEEFLRRLDAGEFSDGEDARVGKILRDIDLVRPGWNPQNKR